MTNFEWAWFILASICFACGIWGMVIEAREYRKAMAMQELCKRYYPALGISAVAFGACWTMMLLIWGGNSEFSWPLGVDGLLLWVCRILLFGGFLMFLVRSISFIVQRVAINRHEATLPYSLRLEARIERRRQAH